MVEKAIVVPFPELFYLPAYSKNLCNKSFISYLPISFYEKISYRDGYSHIIAYLGSILTPFLVMGNILSLFISQLYVLLRT